MTPPGRTTRATPGKPVHRHGHRLRRRWHLAAAIAIVEGLVVAFSPAFSRWTVVALAVLAVLLYLTLRRRTHSKTAHEILWVFACSQTLALILAIVSFFVSWAAFALAALLALVMLVLLAVDRPSRG